MCEGGQRSEVPHGAIRLESPPRLESAPSIQSQTPPRIAALLGAEQSHPHAIQLLPLQSQTLLRAVTQTPRRTSEAEPRNEDSAVPDYCEPCARPSFEGGSCLYGHMPSGG